MKELQECYEEAVGIIGPLAEPFSVVENIERHRNYWRPSKVRILLLAESHVYTSPSESISMRYRNFIEPTHTPESFVRFVYCLGYGEPDFVGSRIGCNYGTPQYWKVFASCLEDPADPQTFAAILKTRNRHFPSRINAKATLLRRLRDHGVWLLDASILALYNPGGVQPNQLAKDKVLCVCWDRYIGDQIDQVKPERIIVIGKNVGRVLVGRLREISGGQHIILSQPQARMSVEELKSTHQTYFRICNLR
jgi:hypothetical protein